MPQVLVTDRGMPRCEGWFMIFVADRSPDSTVGLALSQKNPANPAAVNLFMPPHSSWGTDAVFHALDNLTKEKA